MSEIIEFTVGVPGSGKSYRRCAVLLLKEILNPKEASQHKLLSNFPIQFDPWTDHNGIDHVGLVQMAYDMYGIDEQEVRERVLLFPEDVVSTWKGVCGRGEEPRGPWEYLDELESRGIKLAGSHIAIDEIHNFAPASCGKKKRAWSDWLGEIRHEGFTIEFLTQDPDEVSKAIKGRAGVQRLLIPSKEIRDPFFGIKLDDWYNVGTVFGRPYKPAVYQVEQRKTVSNVKTVWRETERVPFWFEPKYYGVYNSYSASNRTGRSGGQADPAYKRFGKLALVAWFIRRNWWRALANKLITRFAVCVLIIVCMLNFNRVFELINWAMKGKTQVVATDQPDDEKNELGLVEKSEASLSRDLRDQEFEERIERVVELLDTIDGASMVVAVQPGRAFLGDGSLVVVGSSVVLPDGSLTTVRAIDYESRSVHFSNGDSGRVGGSFGVLSRTSETRDTAAELRKSLRAARTFGESHALPVKTKKR